MRDRGSKAVLSAMLAASMLMGGCSTVKGWWNGMTGSDKTSSQSSSQTTTAEQKELCDMNRKMVNMPRDSQEALLESHMQSAHGSSSPQALNAHRQAMMKC